MDDEYYITCGNFNPRSPHGERLRSLTSTDSKATFQSTLPARGATICATVRLVARREFQSTLPARGATRPVLYSEKRGGLISIHAPRTGSDSMIRIFPSSVRHFNPRSPHGERPSKICCFSATWRFQSTLPARGATRHGRGDAGRAAISIHAPRTGSDCYRASCCAILDISIHAPRTGSDLTNFVVKRVSVHISIHAPRTGSD